MSGDAARAFMTLITVCPPASARAPSLDASSSKASATDPGFAYSTSRSSIAAILSRSAHRLRSEEHTSELQSQSNLVCRLLLEKNNNITDIQHLDIYTSI